MYNIKAGRYRHRIEIQERVETKDSSGVRSIAWQTFQLDSSNIMDAVPASVLLGPGREEVAAGAKVASIDARINFRYLPGVTQAMRIIWDGRIFDIVSLSSDETGRLEWRAKCVEGLTTGE